MLSEKTKKLMKIISICNSLLEIGHRGRELLIKTISLLPLHYSLYIVITLLITVNFYCLCCLREI
jgi:hypothetical protein